MVTVTTLNDRNQSGNVSTFPQKPASNLESEKKLSTGNESENDNSESDQPEFNESELMAEIAGEFDPVAEYEIVKNENESLKKIIDADDKLAAAMVAAKLANMQQGTRTDLVENSTMSQSEAATLLNVSRESVISAKKVIEKATPELMQMVERNEVSVSVAATISELEEPEQQEIVAKGEKEILQAAKEIRAKKTEARSQERRIKIKLKLTRPSGGF